MLGVMMVVSAVSLMAQPGSVDIVMPAPQSGVVQGEAFPVRGSGCSPGVTVEIAARDRVVGSTVADSSGSFSGLATLPIRPLGDGPEVGELVLVVACGDARGTVLVVEMEPELARTGAWLSVLAALAMLSIGFGFALRREGLARA